jgi:type II pantothenate kinase
VKPGIKILVLSDKMKSRFFFRQYWLECFEESLDKFVSQAIKSQPHSADAPARAQKFKEKYISRLQYLKQHPW